MAAFAESTTEDTTEKAPEDYTGNLAVYSPHDADPLAAGIASCNLSEKNIHLPESYL